MKQRYLLLMDMIASVVNILMVLIFIPRWLFLSKIPKSKTDDTLHVLANGPSLLEDLNRCSPDLNSIHLLCVNYFALSDEYHVLKPGKYVLVDPVFFKQSPMEDVQNKNELLLKVLADQTDWPLEIYIPWNYLNSKFARKLAQVENVSLFLLPNLPLWGGLPSVNSWLIGRGLATPPFQNVLVASVFFGVIANYSIIHLYGVDHSWLEEMKIGEDNKLYSGASHYYGSEDQKPHATSFGQEITLIDELVTLHQVFKSYHILNRIAKKKGVRVINQTPGSWIDAFERSGINPMHKGKDKR